MGKRYYDNYDYEEAYKEQCKKLEEACSSYGNGIFHACRFMVHRIFESPPGVGVAF